MEAGAGKHIQSPRPLILRAARHPSCMGAEVRVRGLDKTCTPGLGLAAHHCPDVLRPRGPKGLSLPATVLKWLHRCLAVPGVLPRRPC